VANTLKQSAPAAQAGCDVLVIDDHEVVRFGLREILADSPHRLIGEAADSATGLTLCRELQPSVVLLDVRLGNASTRGPGGTLELISSLRKVSRKTRVVIFTAFDHQAYVAEAVAAGAHDYLLKGASAEEIVDAIAGAAVGLPPRRATTLRRAVGMMANRAEVDDIDSPLTLRESQVLTQIANGLSNVEIADALTISVETVKEHVQNLLRKLALSDRTQAAVWAVRRGLA
jgi:DNA-binding NarL/FixJ family response regulator